MNLLAEPDVNVTLAGFDAFVMSEPLILPVTCDVAATVDVKLAVYVPPPLVLNEPSAAEFVALPVTPLPTPVVVLFPNASLSCTVMVDAVEPSAATLVGLAVTVGGNEVGCLRLI